MDMNGRTVLITGSTDGVGRYVAAKLAAQGAKVLIHGRDVARAKILSDEIKRAGGSDPDFYQADLSSLADVREFANAVLADHQRIDVLVSNAGIGSQNDCGRAEGKRGHRELTASGNLHEYHDGARRRRHADLDGGAGR
jgi:NAD(P)-dependent dehydrogenase (short-subunit alcohol dehydrogenase family)